MQTPTIDTCGGFYIPVPSKANAQRIDVPEAEPLRMECEHFLKCMNTCQHPVTDGNEGLQVLRILKAAQRSLDHDSQMVSLSPITDDSFIHKTAIIDDNVTIGRGTKIWHFEFLLPEAWTRISYELQTWNVKCKSTNT